MKKIALALLCVFATGSAAAQTYACQFIMQAGMAKDSAGWKATEFKVDDPFFLTLTDGLIDKKSLAEKPVAQSPYFTTCFKRDLAGTGDSHWCADFAQYLSFNEITLHGGIAKTMGAILSSDAAATSAVTVARFKCQKVR
jgi:hypothetical protein